MRLSAAKPAPNQMGFDLGLPEAPSRPPQSPVPTPRGLGPVSLEELSVTSRYVAMKQLNLASRNLTAVQHEHIKDELKRRRTEKKVSKRLHIATRANLTAILAEDLLEKGGSIQQTLVETRQGEHTIGAAVGYLAFREVNVEDIAYLQSEDMKERVAVTASSFLKEFARLPQDTQAMAEYKSTKRAKIIKDIKKEVRQHPGWTLPAVE